MRQSIMSQQPPYGQPSSQPQDYTRQAMHPAVQPEQPKFIARDPELAQPAHRQTAGKHQPAGKRYGLTGAEPFWYVLGCIYFGAAYMMKLPAKKAASEILSELQFDGGGPSRGYGLTGAGTFWYMLLCILGFGGAYFAKVSAKKGMWELVAILQAAPAEHAEAIHRALHEPAARRQGY
jgi:hypothetical protein